MCVHTREARSADYAMMPPFQKDICIHLYKLFCKVLYKLSNITNRIGPLEDFGRTFVDCGDRVVCSS